MASIRGNRFLLNRDSIPISIVFDDRVLPFFSGSDLDNLRVALSASDANQFLKEFSPDFKHCVYAICGANSADLLAVSPGCLSRPFLDFKHLLRVEGTIEFSLRHITQLPAWTTGKQSKAVTGDLVIVERILGPPYLQGDHKAFNPQGALDFAVSAMLRDAVWINKELCFVSQEYSWDRLYLASKGVSCSVYMKCLYSTTLFGMDDNDTRTYGESGTVYHPRTAVPMRAHEDICEQQPSRTVAVIGPNFSLIRPGMGVVIDPPLHVDGESGRKTPYIETVYGSVLAIETGTGHITVRLLCNQENLPAYVIGGLGFNELIQTNLTLTVPFDWVSGTFHLWPPQLFQADCIPQESETGMRGKCLGRIVVCDMVVSLDGSYCKWTDVLSAPLDVLTRLSKGQLRLTINRLLPFRAREALSYLSSMHELDGGLNPPALAYRCLLGHALTTFARQKVEHARSAKDQLSFRPDMPGRALMELIYRSVPPEEHNVVIRNGNMLVEVKNLDALRPVFGLTPSRFDFRGEGCGVIELHGPFTFKWSMYDTLEPTGALSGSVSISVGSFTEYSRMGTDVIKSSKCHPDALRARRESGLKDPTEGPKEKKARSSRGSQAQTGRKTQVSKAPQQALARLLRQVRRVSLLNVSSSNSDGKEDERNGVTGSSSSAEEEQPSSRLLQKSVVDSE